MLVGANLLPVVKNQWFIDPINGKPNGVGTQTDPWPTWQAAIAAKVVKPCDVIYLMSGDYGVVLINGITNTDFICVMAYPGQTPVLNQLHVRNSANWMFGGLTVVAPESVPKYFPLVLFAACTQIVFTGNTMCSQHDVSAWSPTDWETKAAYRGIGFDGTNSTISGNRISNIRYGAELSGSGILFHGNVIECFADDGVDFTASDIVIQKNTITNHYSKLSDGNHNDGIQGWTVGGGTNRNVLIDSNVVKASDGSNPSVPSNPTGLGADSLQGISIFDGAWIDVTVTNNIVMSSAYHGVSMYGVDNLTVTDNTVLKQCSSPSINTWIGVFNRKDGTTPKNAVVQKNIATHYSITSPNVDSSHNTSLSKNNSWNSDPTNIVIGC